MSVKPHLQIVRDARPPEPMVDEIHPMDCPCCAPARPWLDPDRPLGFHQLGMLALAGVIVGSAIAFAIDAHGAWHALTSIFGGR